MALVFTCAPLAALAAFVGVTGLVQKQKLSSETRVRWGQLSSPQAQQLARNTLAHLLNVSEESLAVESAVAQEGVLLRKEGSTLPIETHAWYVALHSDTNQYLVRLNADTKKVYGINRFEDTEVTLPEVATTRVAARDNSKSLLSLQEGAIRARQCLRQLGISQSAITSLPTRAIHTNVAPRDATPLWEFNYACPAPGWGSRTLRISIDRRTGSIENVWNPAAVLTVS